MAIGPESGARSLRRSSGASRSSGVTDAGRQCNGMRRHAGFRRDAVAALSDDLRRRTWFNLRPTLVDPQSSPGLPSAYERKYATDVGRLRADCREAICALTQAADGARS